MASTTPDTFSFTKLPAELQRQVLLHTGLVIPFRPIGEPQGLEISSGKPQYRDRDDRTCCGKCKSSKLIPPGEKLAICRCVHRPPALLISCTCYQFPLSLLNTGGKLSQLAHQIALSENRIYLTGDISATCTWLRTQPRGLLRNVRSLDLIITSTQLKRWGEVTSITNTHKVPANWAHLVALISERCNLANMTLSIDAAHNYRDLLEDQLIHGDKGKEYWVSLKEAYRALVAPFASRPAFRSMHAFFCFWPLFGKTEAECEKMVMGGDYEAQEKGKIRYEKRDWRLPHGWEWWEMDDETAEWNPDFEGYKERFMQDIE